MTALETQPAFDVEALRAQFPILHQTVHGKSLVYLDSAATSQKPQVVIDAIRDYYERYNANVHRGMHHLSGLATEGYEDARKKVGHFLNARSVRECVFVRGATEAINLVAASYGAQALQKGDRVLITWMEHHSNIVPWQMICGYKGAHLDVAPIDERGQLDMGAFRKLLERQPKIVSCVWVSNALGTVNPVKEIVRLAHDAGAVVMIDACQQAAHGRIDVRDLGCDFLAISGHKMFGPTGIGVLWGREELLAAMPPYQGGGEMIEQVTFEKTTYAPTPARFEAGTPNIAGAIGLGAAVDFHQTLDMDAIGRHEADLLAYGTSRLSEIDGLRFVGTAEKKASILGFVVEGMHPYDLAPVLDRYGVAVRTGHHCAQPVMDFFKIPATVRASLAMYNTRAEIDALVDALHKARRFFM